MSNVILSTDEVEFLIFALELAEHESFGESKELIAKLKPLIETSDDEDVEVKCVPLGNAGNGWDFPIALGQLADGEVNLDLWAGTQFVQNETLLISSIDVANKVTTYLIQHTPVLAGTVTGILDFGDNNDNIYSFVISQNKGFTFSKLIDGNYEPVQCNKLGLASVSINWQTGNLSFQWKYAEYEPKVTVNYEYTME